MVFDEGMDVTRLENCIVECSWDGEEGVWRYMRVRSDKDTPNAYHVYEKVMQSIHDNITEEDLQEEIKVLPGPTVAALPRPNHIYWNQGRGFIRQAIKRVKRELLYKEHRCLLIYLTLCVPCMGRHHWSFCQ